MTSAAITAKDLTVGWSSEAVLLDGVSFEVASGEIFAILGGSGSGKSTLLRNLVGLEPPLFGEIRLYDKPHTELRVGRPMFGMMFQSGALFGSLSLIDNISLPILEWTALPRDVAHNMARAKLKLVGLEHAALKLPAELSGGMRKRAAIARAMALEPPLVFLDEPTAGLDPVTAAEIDDLIKTLNEVVGVTVVLVTHELASLHAIAQRCIMLDHDEKGVIAVGSPTELDESEDPRVRRFFHRQARSAQS